MVETPEASDYSASLRRAKILGVALIGTFLGGFGVWAATAPIDGAIIAAGRLEVSGAAKHIQHVNGGSVAEIPVHEGQRVAAGDLLLRLDDTVARANRDILVGQLDVLRVRAARLDAEARGLATFADPATLDGPKEAVATLIEGERSLLAARAAAREGQKAQLVERITQLQAQIAGQNQQAQAKTREVELLERDLEGLRKLSASNLVPQARLNDMEREATRLEGQRGAIMASIAEIGGRIAETRLMSLNIDETAAADANRDLRETQAKIDEYAERLLAARDQLDHVAIRSPVAGIVHQLAVHTIGGVVGAGVTLMTIVPTDADLVIEARIAAQDVDAVRAGEKAVIRLSGLNRATTPELSGRVSVVGADLVTDEATRTAYYPVRVALDAGSVARLGDVTLVPGMPAETYIVTAQRTFLDYLVKPISDRMDRTFRED